MSAFKFSAPILACFVPFILLVHGLSVFRETIRIRALDQQDLKLLAHPEVQQGPPPVGQQAGEAPPSPISLSVFFSHGRI